MIYISDLIRRYGAMSYDARHDLSGWKIRLYLLKGGRLEIELSRHATLILDK